MQYSISTAITTVLLASSFTSAIPVVQKPQNSTDTQVTVEFTGASELAVQHQVTANGKPAKINNAKGVTDAEVIDANGLGQVQCLAFDAQGMQISSAFGLNKDAHLGGPATNEGGVDVAKVICSADGGIASAPKGKHQGTKSSGQHDGDHDGTKSSGQHDGDDDGPSSSMSMSMSKRATAVTDVESTGPTGQAGGKGQGQVKSGTKPSENGPIATPTPPAPPMHRNDRNGTVSNGGSSNSGWPIVRIALSGLSEREVQQPIPADMKKHKVRNAIQITEAEVLDAHGQSVACRAFDNNGKRIGGKHGVFSNGHKAELGQHDVGVNVAEVACIIQDGAPVPRPSKSGSASPSKGTGTATGTGSKLPTTPAGPVISDPIETAPGPIATGPFASGKGKGNDGSSSSGTGVTTAPGPEATGPFASGKSKGGSDSSPSSSGTGVETAPGPEATGPFKSAGKDPKPTASA